jgi:hypothetical protein
MCGSHAEKFASPQKGIGRKQTQALREIPRAEVCGGTLTATTSLTFNQNLLAVCHNFGLLT